jgi:hypothetical protein
VAGTTYTLRWTISNAPCAASTDDVVINLGANPAANAGPDQTVCALTATLAGNTPTVGTGAWTKVSGPGTVTFGNANSPTSSATVSAAGSYTLRWTITNASCTATDDVVLNLNTVTLNPTSLPNGQAGVNYSQTLSTSPSGSATYAVTLGNLPSGLVLNAQTGLLSGRPVTVGTSNFTIRATATGGCQASRAYTLVVECPTIALSPASLPNGTIATPYSQTLSATPAGGNYSYSITSGSLPAGLALNSATGVISGNPTTASTYNFRITARGWGNCTGFRDYTIVISGGPCSTVTLPASLPGGTVGALYSNSVAASPAGSYSYTSSGTLPPGVSLMSTGLLFGYPTAAGSYTFTVTATQGACTGSQSYMVAIGASFGGASARTVVNDFDGDGKSDVWSYQPETGRWLVQHSSDGTFGIARLGSPNDLAVPADYDGDGKTDIAVFNAASSRWQIRQSTTGELRDEQFGEVNAAAYPADYDGDGKADLAVRTAQGEWQIRRSIDGELMSFAFGAPEDRTVVGDFDSDGRADAAVYVVAEGRVVLRLSRDGSLHEIPMPYVPADDSVLLAADFDGDGIDELVWWSVSQGTLRFVRSSDQQEQTLASNGTMLLLGDYDGDRRADCLLWHNSGWKTLLSSRTWLNE